MASFMEVPAEEMAKGDFLGVAGTGVSSCDVACGGGCVAGTGGAALCAVCGVCCCACWAGAGGAAGFGGPGRRWSISLRKVSLVGVLVCAMRFLSESTSVLGRFTLS